MTLKIKSIFTLLGIAFVLILIISKRQRPKIILGPDMHCAD